ncbi:MAG: FAD-binding oxidoreductase [Acidobacteria bacterium]|nr:FAD-binding oxidoreductase [Acidobacteriota bacterium]
MKTAISRREFVKSTSMALAAFPAAGCIPAPIHVGTPNASAIPAHAADALVNDVHSQLNLTRVDRIVKPMDIDELRTAVMRAREDGRSVCVAGGRHAMGGQQFGEAGVLVDTRSLNRVLEFDDENGFVTVEAGIQWPQLLDYLNQAQEGRNKQWGIVQKQTGADRLSIGGALACNAHGRGLTLKPIIQQVDRFDLMDAAGRIRTCSRTEHEELFRLAIGGYGLFGIMTRVRLKLRPRVKVRRVVALGQTEGIIGWFDERIRDGYLYGDYQFTTDSTRESFLRRGVFSCYRPVPENTPLTQNATRFQPEDWARLTFYAHKYKRRAFQVYSSRYLKTSGQVYWADWQLSAAYVDDYHADLDRALGAKVKGTEMITEIYVPRPKLAAFMEAARGALRATRANMIYGTVRLIEKDEESFLAWARERWACVIFNLHIDHTPAGIDAAADAFRDLTDLGIGHGGSYYLTYHRWARKDQVEACYPQMREFLAMKRRHDPDEVFQSNWYRHYRAMFG